MAHAGLAEAYAALSGFYVHPREVMPKAKQAAETALRLDESVADAHAVLGLHHLVYDWDETRRGEGAAACARSNPTLASARLHYAAISQVRRGNEESAREVGRAVYFDPLSARTHAFGSMFLNSRGATRKRSNWARKGLELEPNHAFALAFQGLAYAEQGRFEQSHRQSASAVQRGDNPTIVALQAHVYALAGQKEQAKTRSCNSKRNSRTDTSARTNRSRDVDPGDLDTAYQWFRKGVVGSCRLHGMAWRRTMD